MLSSNVQTSQGFQPHVFDISLDTYATNPDGTRYVDIRYLGNTIYIPPESFPVGVNIYLNDVGQSTLARAPTTYPGGSIEAEFAFFRMVFPAHVAGQTGNIIVYTMRNAAFRSGSILINAPGGGANPTANYITPFSPHIVSGTDDAVSFPVAAGNWANGDLSSQAENIGVNMSVAITIRASSPTGTYIYYTFSRVSSDPTNSVETYGMLLPNSRIVVTPPIGSNFLHVYAEGGSIDVNAAPGVGS